MNTYRFSTVSMLCAVRNEPVSAVPLVLEMAEEIKRSGRDVPSVEFLSSFNANKIQMQNAMLIASLNMKEEFVELVKNAPKGGELFERIRARSLDA